MLIVEGGEGGRVYYLDWCWMAKKVKNVEENVDKVE